MDRFKAQTSKMKLATEAKLLGILTVLMVLACAAALFVSNHVNRQQGDMAYRRLQYILFMDGFGDTSVYLTNEVRSYASTADQNHYNNYWYEVDVAKNREYYAEQLRTLGLTEREDAILTEVFNLSNSLIPLEEQAMDCVMAQDQNGAVQILYGSEYTAGVKRIQELILEFQNLVKARIDNHMAEAQRNVSRMEVLAYIAVGVTLFVQCFVLHFTLRELLAPLIKFRQQMLSFVEGDLNATVDLPDDTTEVGETGRAIREFQIYQKELIADIDYLLTNIAAEKYEVESRCPASYKGNYANILHTMQTIKFVLEKNTHDMQVAHDLLNGIYQTAPCSIVRLVRQNTRYELTTANAATAQLFGVTEGKLRQMDWSQGFPADTVLVEDQSVLVDAFQRLNKPGTSVPVEFRLHDQLERVFHVSATLTFVSDSPEGDVIQAIVFDITDRVREERKRRQVLIDEASTDYLTGLYTRRYATNMINDYLRTGEGYGCLLLDLDRFKQINDTYGHIKGDEVLCALGGILKELFREKDLCARLGGDEFIIFLPNASAAATLQKRAQQIIEKFSEVLIQLGIEGSAGVSVGGVYGTGNTTFEKIYRQADEHLYWVKENAKGTWKIEPTI